MADVVEVMANALWDVAPDDMTDEAASTMARAALSALSDAGYVVVRKPQGCIELMPGVSEGFEIVGNVFDAKPEPAMLSAAPAPK